MARNRRPGAIARIAKELLAWPLGRRRWFRVRGHSMTPSLHEGDLVLVRRCAGLPTKGSVVVVRDPERQEAVLVKRVRSLGRDTFSVGSDNPEAGRDSRHFGSLDRGALLGYVSLVFAHDARIFELGEP